MLRYLIATSAILVAIPADSLAEGPARSQCISIAEKAPPGSTWSTTSDDGSVTVHWCAQKLGPPSEEVNLLVSVLRPRHPWADCPHLIPLNWGPYPQIRVVAQHPDLYGVPARYRDFTFFGGSGEPIPLDGAARGPHIDTGVGDAGQLVICVNGRWAFAGYH